MRAVNLVPAEARTGGVSGGKSGGAVYGVLGVLVVLLLGVAVLSVSKKSQKEAEQELAAVQQSTQAYTTVASQYSSFESAASQAASRIETVRGLAQARFDWAGTMRDLSRLVPPTTQIYNLNASVRDGVGASGGATSQLRGAQATPAITLSGCSKGQVEVANLVNQLQAMRRVTNVALESSREIAESSAGVCTIKNGYDFVLVVFFAAGKSQPAGEATTAPTGNAAAIASASSAPPTTPTSASSTTTTTTTTEAGK